MSLTWDANLARIIGLMMSRRPDGNTIYICASVLMNGTLLVLLGVDSQDI